MCQRVSPVRSTSAIRQYRALTLSGAISTASFQKPEVMRTGQSTSQVPAMNRPITAAFLMPMKPSRKRPVRATVPLTFSR
ncbi:MAG: hypothetical protein EB141_11235 [Verrucomicrobia bacterium]|nr:hypothetical protein [Pseudomonadota bacterium]NDB76199.1 hypothetical protein [Verrucomicrobiota bacterium]